MLSFIWWTIVSAIILGFFVWWITWFDDFTILNAIYNNQENTFKNRKFIIMWFLFSVLIILIISAVFSIIWSQFPNEILIFLLLLWWFYIFFLGYLTFQENNTKTKKDHFSFVPWWFLSWILAFSLNSFDDIWINISLMITMSEEMIVWFIFWNLLWAVLMVYLVKSFGENQKLSIIKNKKFRWFSLIIISLIVFLSAIIQIYM